MAFLKINNLSVNYEMRRETVYAAKEVNYLKLFHISVNQVPSAIPKR